MIVAVVVTHSAPADVVDRCLDALGAAGGVDHIVVVDTGNHIDSGNHIGPRHHSSKEWSGDAPFEVIQSENHGYGAAANVGFGRATALGATAVALLNDDVVVAAGWLEPLVAELRDGVGAAQPVLAEPGRRRINSCGVRIGRDGAGIDVGRGDELATGDEPGDLELFTGGAVVFDAAFLEATGGFDKRYFLYYEDVDLGRRGAALGWRYRLVPASVVEHEGGVSTGALPDRTRYLQERNRLWAAFRFADVATIGRAVWLSARRLRHRPRRTHAGALLAGLSGAPVRLWERRRAPGAQRPW